MTKQNDTPNQRKMKRDYFFIAVYILVALVIISQFFVIFSIDILEKLGII